MNNRFKPIPLAAFMTLACFSAPLLAQDVDQEEDSDEAIEARYHTKVVSLVAIERECCRGDAPELMEIKR